MKQVYEGYLEWCRIDFDGTGVYLPTLCDEVGNLGAVKTVGELLEAFADKWVRLTIEDMEEVA